MSGQRQDEGEASGSRDEDWRAVADQTERRKIQNRIAQRKYREKTKRQKEDEVRISENQHAAGSAYTSARPEDLERNSDPTGLPWGSIPSRQAIEAGKAKQQRSQQTSREGSTAAGYDRGVNQGPPLANVGLQLSDHFARRILAWESFWRR